MAQFPIKYLSNFVTRPIVVIHTINKIENRNETKIFKITEYCHCRTVSLITAKTFQYCSVVTFSQKTGNEGSCGELSEISDGQDLG